MDTSVVKISKTKKTKHKTRSSEILDKYETDETNEPTNTQLQRLVLLKQLDLMDRKRRSLENDAATTYTLHYYSIVPTDLK